MKSLRETLVDSHISAIAIAVLLFFFLDYAVRALWGPLSAAVMFVLTAIAIHAMPKRMNLYEQAELMSAILFFLEAAVTLIAAQLLSRCIHGAGPFASLKQHCAELARRKHV